MMYHVEYYAQGRWHPWATFLYRAMAKAVVNEKRAGRSVPLRIRDVPYA
jgi:hypothetical protein